MIVNKAARRLRSDRSQMEYLAICALLLCCSGYCFAQTTTAPVNGDLRLVDGLNITEGRIEIFIDGEWGTVCDDFWSVANSIVVCRQLGFPVSGARFSFFSSGSGTIFLDNIQCTGNETRLLDCDANEIRMHNCGHFEDAGVVCEEAPSIDPPNGNIRLSGGASSSEGRVEVFVDGVWGTVCDDFWGDTNAAIVCRQLNFTDAMSIVITDTRFGQGTGIIWLDNVDCVGTEDRLIECPSLPLGSHNCDHFEDVGVICLLPSDEDVPSGSVRLVDGDNEFGGRVEIFLNGYWGTVCDDSWDDEDAAVVCRQLGLQTRFPRAIALSFFGAGIGLIWLDEVDCSGLEEGLADCAHGGIGVHNCSPFEDAGVICIPDSAISCNIGEVRLVNGSTPQEGRVEVCLYGDWGTVCDDLWTNTNAKVVCRQLMLPFTNATALGSAFFGQGNSLPINLDNVQCTGEEANIIDCTFSDTNNCGHSEDAGVRCQDATPLPPGVSVGDIRLVNGNTRFEGRVELLNMDGIWGTVCDDSWDELDAQVVCRQLGYPIEGAEALQNAAFGRGSFSQPILLDDLSCTGIETRLVDCDHNGINIHNCFHGEDASVRCMLPPAPGFPANVEIKPSKTDCSEVTITWDYPKDYMYPNLISYYSLLVTSLSPGGLTIRFNSTTEQAVVNNLDCDSDYILFISTYAVNSGPQSDAIHFTTGTSVSSAASSSTIAAAVAVPLLVLVLVVVVATVIIVVLVMSKQKNNRSRLSEVASDGDMEIENKGFGDSQKFDTSIYPLTSKDSQYT